ncbi:MAG TPA: DUF4347 domain-containing protein, partial [Gammaproteobacteria bacterium]|nr:DUF4347 domain-containing protein [Gammaproteobacteria bacterium]
MFERLRNRVLSRGSRRDGGRGPAKRLIVEELEPWILMSADAAPAFDAFRSPLTTEHETHELLLDSGELSGSLAVGTVAAGVRHEIVFVDARLADHEQIVSGLPGGSGDRQIEVFVIEAGEDGLERITEVLGARQGVDAVHVFSHGVDGAVELGDSWLNGAVLEMRSETVAGWRSALSADADLLLYGCNVGHDTEGKAFLDRLSELTGADVAASDDATGAAALGGDWNLEVATGSIETSAALGAGVQQSWTHVMAISVGNSSSAASAGAASSLTWAHTVDGGSDGLLLVTVSVETDTGTTVGSVTYGGVALTRLDAATSTRDHVEMWYLKLPAAGTANIVVTLSSGADRVAAGATDFFGVEQDSSAYSSGSVVTASGTGDPSLTIASAAGELVVDGVADRDIDSEFVGASQTVLFTNKTGTSPGDAWVGSSYEAGAASVTMSWTTNGPGGQWAAIAVALKPAGNAAPVLDASRTPVLSAVAEDAGAPSGAVGTGVQFGLVDFVVPSGQIDSVTDTDPGAVTGVAVIGADTTNGTWWYSTNNGGTWLALGAVSNTNARLLAADGSTRIYFQPNANFNGTIANAITFRAWDRTSGVNGGTANASINGGTTAFSTATDTANLTVTAVNDAPTTAPVTLAPLAEDGGSRLITQAQLLANASDVDGNPLTATALAIASGAGSLVDNGNGTWTYTPAPNDSTSVSFSYTIADGNGGTVAGSATLDLTPVNDPPTTSPVTLAPLAEDGGSRLITQAQLLANASDVDG